MFAIHPILCVFSFWFPLLLTAKAIQKPNKNIQFLLLYWIFYIAVSNIQYYLLEFNLIPFRTFIMLLGDLIDLWLFYSHGCLVLAYYYIPKLLQQNERHPLIDRMDHDYIDPFVSTFVVRNAIVQKLLGLISVRISPIDDFICFNNELCKHYSSKQKRLSFLAFSVEYFCYMDSPTELHSRYLKSEKLIRHLSSSVSRAASASASKTSGFLESPASDSSANDQIVCDSLDDVIYRPRHSRNSTPKDPSTPKVTGLKPPVYLSSYDSPRNNELPELGRAQALPKVRSLSHMEANRKKTLHRRTSSGERPHPPYPLRSGSG